MQQQEAGGPRVVVVGGGASAVLAAVALAHEHGIGSITVVGRDDRVGPGLAYGAASPHHLLNSPAGRMSADPRDEDAFVAWSAAHGDPVERSAFAPRRRYGDYLESVFADLAAADPRVTAVRGEVVAVEPGLVRLADGRELPADHVLLALGNPPPAGRGAAVPDPWAPGALDAVTSGSVLLLGTGLTTLDVATRLARRSPAVRLTATSRHALLPRTHLTEPAPAGPGLAPEGRSLGAVLHAFGERRRAARADGRPWQAEVDGIRPQVDSLWAMLDAEDRQRFLARVSRIWEVHRHRMAPAVAAELDGLRESGRLRIVAHADPADYDVVVDCTGPRATVAAGWSPVVDALLADGSARPDALASGLDVTDAGEVRRADGTPSAVLSAIGPARRGSQWETTAVPEIRTQAGVVARRIAAA